ncbi:MULTISPECIES: hypothetical protein [Pseudomonas]|uniref:hypothetical protein n=1 Tax=Pseudomonas TaxID=286 RepID=UPI000EF72238|nr:MULTISPECIES: hypothetical protein [Pseudomonas]AYN18972.1 hypothetical protein CHR29_28060 [Pseudomonas monteilii]MCE1038507.1 hypothetical protein [Pseudomonas monteilii]MCL8328758.1 hypothetical protein [Pseudomonas juntendi]MDD2061445.1 hypothetical protein [Pseudomonas putida]UJW25443.1 hypothetical protein L2Y89_28040 [Pseudomonas juntendi]
MTTQAAEELDIFNAGVKPGKQAETPKAQTQQPEKTPPVNAIQGDRKKRIANFVNQIEAWHFLVLAVVLAAVFVLVPKMLPKAQTSAPQQQPTPVQQAAPVSNVSDVLAPQEPLAPAADPEQAGITVEQLNALNEQVRSLGGIVVGLQKTIDELEAKVSLLEAAPAASKKVVQQHAVRRQPQATQPSAVAGYRLNTVYADQAWLEHGDKTFVVQVGDLVDGVKIIGIDPVARRVTTSRGVIR